MSQGLGSSMVYLRRSLRELVFSRCYERESSLRGVAKALGYKAGGGSNGVARDMWMGKIAIPSKSLESLSKVSGIPLAIIRDGIVPRHQNEVSDDWVEVYSNYLKEKL
jgi:hypothetical protein